MLTSRSTGRPPDGGSWRAATADFGANQKFKLRHYPNRIHADVTRETRREIDDGAFGSKIVLECLAQGFSGRPAKAWLSRRFFDR
jgi:hypothetical protein